MPHWYWHNYTVECSVYFVKYRSDPPPHPPHPLNYLNKGVQNPPDFYFKLISYLIQFTFTYTLHERKQIMRFNKN